MWCMMKIVSWNVNGLRAIVKKLPSGLGAFFKDIGADIICLQESKITEKMLTDDLTQIPGYEAFFATCKMKQGYSGVWYEVTTRFRSNRVATLIHTAPSKHLRTRGDHARCQRGPWRGQGYARRVCLVSCVVCVVFCAWWLNERKSRDGRRGSGDGDGPRYLRAAQHLLP